MGLRTKTYLRPRTADARFLYNRFALGSAGDLTGGLIADRYELLRLIGRGGMGAVYEARNVSTFKRCAVKVLLSPELAGDEEVVRRFFREARASGLIESEHVVAAFDSGIDAGERAYYVMECLQGEDLEQALDRLGQLRPQAAMKVVRQAAAGLASAHALGIVHRDVKPANLFLAVGSHDELKVKILDFGVAKVKMELFNESSNTLTHSGSLLGTPIYMSPEQLRRASDIDDSADVWSLGVVLFECLTGQLPWGECDGIGELVTAILTQPVPHVQDLAPWVEPELAQIVHRALSRDRTYRLRSAAELRDALQQLLGDARLYAHELVVPDERERRARAPRLTSPEALLLGATPSTIPAVAGPPAPRPHRSLVTALVAVTTLAGAAAWTWKPARHPAGGTGALSEAAKPPSSVLLSDPLSSQPPTSVAATGSSSAEGRRQFTLKVVPHDAQVELNGSMLPVDGGRVRIDGRVGTTYEVRVRSGDRSTTKLIRLTDEGLVPNRVALTPRGATPPEPKPEHVTPVGESPPSGEVPSVPTARTQLEISERYE